jgi:hypothetical protein
MSTHSIIENITIDRLYTIERERENTIADPDFQQWCKDMKIGARVQKREGIDNANALMAQWNNEVRSGLPQWIRRMY